MDPSEHLQTLGRQAYKRENYHAALNFFNSVISQERQPSATVLDCRAATYEKLGDLHTALKDGRRIISEYKTDSTGYLRTGKLLQLLGKDTVALDIYKYGLRNVPLSDTKFQLLRDTCQTMNWRYGLCKTQDPLAVLPTEVAEMIMSYLEFRQVVSLTRVSTNWRDFLRSVSKLWISLDFSKAGAKIPKAAVRRYVQLSQRRLTKAVMSRFATQTPGNLHLIVTSTKCFEHLEFRSGYINTSLIKATSIAKNLKCLLLSARCETSLDCISQILGKCTQLVRAEFHSITRGRVTPLWQGDMSRLQILSLRMVRDLSRSEATIVPSFSPLIAMIPDIRELSLEGWRSMDTAIPTAGSGWMAKLEKLRLVGFMGEINPRALPSLRILELFDCHYILESFSRLSKQGTVDDRVGGLTEFALSSPYLRIDTLLQLLGSAPLGLRKLHLIHCTEVNAVDLSRLIGMGYMDHVIDLDLSGTHVTDTVVESLASRAHRLRRIKLAMTGITGCGVKALVGRPKSELQHLDIRDCQSVRADAVAFARQFKNLTVETGGQPYKAQKKIRYE